MLLCVVISYFKIFFINNTDVVQDKSCCKCKQSDDRQHDGKYQRRNFVNIFIFKIFSDGNNHKNDTNNKENNRNGAEK